MASSFSNNAKPGWGNTCKTRGECNRAASHAHLSHYRFVSASICVYPWFFLLWPLFLLTRRFTQTPCIVAIRHEAGIFILRGLFVATVVRRPP